MKILRSLLSYLLSLSILLSIGGVSIYKHYCGDFLADFSLFMPSDGCGGGDEEESCAMQKSGCCEDETEHISADLEVVKQDQGSFQLVPNFFGIYQLDNKEVPLRSVGLCAEQLIPPIHSPPLYILNTQLTYYG